MYAIKRKIQSALLSLDAGKFQSFCQDLLPFVHVKYAGLERFGGTIDDKTRKGTPDLIKTAKDGDQTAVQCSVDENYWNAPKEQEKYSGWKPCIDVDKCIKNLEKIEEIVLCSNREISTSNPNAKLEVISYAAPKTTAAITLFCATDIENIIRVSLVTPSFVAILKDYLPEVYEELLTQAEISKYRLAADVIKTNQPLPFEKILEIAERAVKNNFDKDKQYADAMREIETAKSRFELKNMPSAGKIIRQPLSNPEFTNPIGRVLSLTGVHKIGKSTLIAQMAGKWVQDGIKVVWFEAPLEDTLKNEFVEELIRVVTNEFLDGSSAYEIAKGVVQLHSVTENMINEGKSIPTIFVIDNSENIASRELMQRFEQLISFLKRVGLSEKYGFIFISKKSIRHLNPEISLEVGISAWKRNELEQLLESEIQDSDHWKMQGYMNILEVKSYGHPRLAVALARKYRTRDELFNLIFASSLTENDELVEQIKVLLFEDILGEDDASREYVFRMSPIIHRLKEKSLVALAKNIAPPISIPFKTCLRKLQGCVIEGDDEIGYGVTSIYRDIAQKDFENERKKEIYEVVAVSLLKPEGKTYNANDITTGITYLFLAGKIDQALWWTNFLLNGLNKKELASWQTRSIVEELYVIRFLSLPNDHKSIMLANLALFQIAMLYSNINEYKKAAETLEGIKLPKESGIPELDEASRLMFEAKEMYWAILKANDDPVKSLEKLGRIDFSIFDKSKMVKAIDLGQFANDILKKESVQTASAEVIKAVMRVSDVNDSEDMLNCLSFITTLAVKALKSKERPDDCLRKIPDDMGISPLCKMFFEAQYCLEGGRYEDALGKSEIIIKWLKDEKIKNEGISILLYQMRGDTYLKLDDRENSGKAFVQSLSDGKPPKTSFNYGWAHYRLGLLSSTPVDARRHFEEASFAFRKSKINYMLAKSEGERAVACGLAGDHYEFGRIAEWITRKYYINKKEEYAASTLLAIALVLRLTRDIEGSPLQSNDHPEFKIGLFNQISDAGRPRASAFIAYVQLASLYNALNKKKRKLRCLRIAFRKGADDQLSANAKPLAIKELLAELNPAEDEQEICEIMLSGMSTELAPPFKFPFHSWCLFSNVDTSMSSTDEGNKSSLSKILIILKSRFQSLEVPQKDLWRLEIDIRWLRYCRDQLGGKVAYKISEEGYRLALEIQNHEMICQFGHEFGFVTENFSHGMSIKDIADIHFNIVKSIVLSKENLDRLITAGSNMFVIWRGMRWSRLYEKDIKPKQFMLDSAQELEKAGFARDRAAVLMILLVSELNNFDIDKDWLLKHPIEKMNIPADILKRLSL